MGACFGRRDCHHQVYLGRHFSKARIRWVAVYGGLPRLDDKSRTPEFAAQKSREGLLAYGGVLFADDRDRLGIEDRVQGTSVSEQRFGRTGPKLWEAEVELS